mgnify:CR=1 FL=1
MYPVVVGCCMSHEAPDHSNYCHSDCCFESCQTHWTLTSDPHSHSRCSALDQSWRPWYQGALPCQIGWSGFPRSHHQLACYFSACWRPDQPWRFLVRPRRRKVAYRTWVSSVWVGYGRRSDIPGPALPWETCTPSPFWRGPVCWRPC